MDRKATIDRARRLRRNPSTTERLLWSRLRQRKYVLDFVCLRYRLVIEADGPFHDPERDAIRDGWLAAKGFRVLRFTNAEIHGSPDLVAGRILLALEEPPPVRKL